MIGYVFGKLTVLSECGRSKDKQKMYLCRCTCGNEVKVISGNLKKGNSTSCGCSRLKSCAIRMSKLNFRHGESNTKLWKTWKGIIERTTLKTHTHYSRYGGRGITVCEEWLTYENFAKDVGQPPSERHSIDRIDNDKGYFPGNVRWATMKEQSANRSTNIRVAIADQIVILSDAARMLNISKSTASRWLKIGKLKKIEQQKFN